jgi:hypothetical protein
MSRKPMGHLRQYFDLTNHLSIIQPALKWLEFLAISKPVELRLNGWSDQNIVLSDPSAFLTF